MPNIFDGIKKISEEDLREQIAILETFTMTNLSKQTGQKVAKKLVEATNLVTGLMKKEPLKTPEVLSTKELIDRNKQQWQMLQREELEIHLRNVLIARCNALKPATIEEDASEDALSIFMIEQAADLYDLKEELLPSQKADIIAKCYEDEMKEHQKELEKEEEASENLQIPLGKNKVIRELFAKLIALSVEAYGGQMVTKEEDLPSWLPARERYTLDQAYQSLMKQHSQNEEQYKKVLQDLLENDREINTKKRLIEYEKNKQQEANARIKKLNTEKEALVANFEQSVKDEPWQLEIETQHLAKEMKMKDSQITTYKGIWMMSREEIESAKKSIDALQRKKDEDITKAVQKAIEKKDETAELIQHEKEERERKLEEKWKTAYEKFKFEEECLKAIHDTFVVYECMDIERALLELHSAQDIGAFSWGELDQKDYEMFGLMQDEHTLQHIAFSLVSGIIVILIYEVLEEEQHKARIVKILKYNEEVNAP